MAKNERPEDVTVLRKFQDELPCVLNHAELLQRGDALARTLENIKLLDSEHDMAKRAMKSEMSVLEAKRDKLSLEVTRRQETRLVDCEELACPDGKARIIRLDTDAIIEERQMTAEELQRELSLEEQAEQT